jgi:hypothetical protein
VQFCCVMVHCVCVHPFVTSKRPRTIQSTGMASQMIHPAKTAIKNAMNRGCLSRITTLASTCAGALAVPSPGPSADSWSPFGITHGHGSSPPAMGPAALGGAAGMRPESLSSWDMPYTHTRVGVSEGCAASFVWSE